MIKPPLGEPLLELRGMDVPAPPDGGPDIVVLFQRWPIAGSASFSSL